MVDPPWRLDPLQTIVALRLAQSFLCGVDALSPEILITDDAAVSPASPGASYADGILKEDSFWSFDVDDDLNIIATSELTDTEDDDSDAPVLLFPSVALINNVYLGILDVESNTVSDVTIYNSQTFRFAGAILVNGGDGILVALSAQTTDGGLTTGNDPDAMPEGLPDLPPGQEYVVANIQQLQSGSITLTGYDKNGVQIWQTIFDPAYSDIELPAIHDSWIDIPQWEPCVIESFGIAASKKSVVVIGTWVEPDGPGFTSFIREYDITTGELKLSLDGVSTSGDPPSGSLTFKPGSVRYVRSHPLP